MNHPPATRRRTAALALVLGLVATLVPIVVTAAPAAAAPLTTADFAGRGWGHGRGMSQYGAFGYARDFGWGTEQILSHYYGGTRAGLASTAGGVTINPNAVRIRLMALDGQPGTLVGTGSSTTLQLAGAEPLPPLPPEAKAVRMLRAGDHWNVDWASSCNGPWTVLGASQGGTITVSRKTGTEELHTCLPDGSRRHYAGSIRATITSAGTRTMNITTIEEYLRGVVPNEMPSSWHPNALQAQSVSARSYAMAGDIRHDPDGANIGAPPYADTCDTTLCQVYKGRYTQSSPTAPKVASTHPNTDAAIAATTGQVRVFTSNGNIARTEFSSTSGGWTAGGTFPAVEDKGDVISPLHTWRVEDVSLAPLAGLGAGNLTAMRVTERNGLGADGGRVLEVELDFDGEDQPVVATGNTIRSRLGLRSDWFSIMNRSGFLDVPDDSVYADAVGWAVGQDITEGCTTTKFCPGADVTRAQAATFLWRHAGEPTPTSPQFDDVEQGAYYYDAVRWVRDEGITTGCTDTEFCPNGSATRAHLVTFLWRHAGEPASSGGNSFSDVPEGAYYEEAVDWAVEQGITQGTSADRFSPNDHVSRGQTVLFLFRYLA